MILISLQLLLLLLLLYLLLSLFSICLWSSPFFQWFLHVAWLLTVKIHLFFWCDLSCWTFTAICRPLSSTANQSSGVNRGGASSLEPIWVLQKITFETHRLWFHINLVKLTVSLLLVTSSTCFIDKWNHWRKERRDLEKKIGHYSLGTCLKRLGKKWQRGRQLHCWQWHPKWVRNGLKWVRNATGMTAYSV